MNFTSRCVGEASRPTVPVDLAGVAATRFRRRRRHRPGVRGHRFTNRS